MRSGISAERLLYIVGMIYDCVIAPERWGEVTDIIRLDDVEYPSGLCT